MATPTTPGPDTPVATTTGPIPTTGPVATTTGPVATIGLSRDDRSDSDD